MGELELESLFEFSPGQDIEDVKAEYQERLYNSMADYLESGSPITRFRNEFRRSVNDGFTFAFVAGWADAGASELTDKAQSWLNGRISDEISFADTLFTQLKALREDPELTMDEKLDAAEAHAAGYTNALTGVYARGEMMGEPEQMLTWHEGDTTDKCDTCLSLDGQRHPASWFIDKGYIPQESGSGTLDCGGWNCLCSLVNDKGEQVIP